MSRATFAQVNFFAHAIPVSTSSSAGSLSEVSGPAFIVDPQDPKDIATGMMTACKLPTAKREELVDTGIAWAKKFTWAKVARDTVKVYEKLVERP